MQTIDLVLKVLSSGPKAVPEMVDLTRKNKSGIQKALDKLAARKLVYICDYKTVGARGSYARVWSLGDKPNVPMPVLKHKPRPSRALVNPEVYIPPSEPVRIGLWGL